MVSGSDGDCRSYIHWLLYKEVKNDEDPYKGITTKEIYEKGKK